MEPYWLVSMVLYWFYIELCYHYSWFVSGSILNYVGSLLVLGWFYLALFVQQWFYIEPNRFYLSSKCALIRFLHGSMWNPFDNFWFYCGSIWFFCGSI